MIPDPRVATVTDLYQDDVSLDAEVDREIRHVPVFDWWQDRLPVRLMRYAAQTPFMMWIRWLMRAEYRGLENLPRSGPVILAANHRSHSDTPLILSALPFAVRNRVAPAAAKDFWFRRRFKSTLVRAYFNALAVTRPGQDARSMISALVRWMLRGGGRALLIYPEGGRVDDNRKLGEFKAGPARVALLSGAPVIPVAVTGTEHVLAKTSRLPKRAPFPCRVTFGKPILPSEFDEENRTNEVRAARTFTKRLHDDLLALIEEAEADAIAAGHVPKTVPAIEADAGEADSPAADQPAAGRSGSEGSSSDMDTAAVVPAGSGNAEDADANGSAAPTDGASAPGRRSDILPRAFSVRSHN